MFRGAGNEGQETDETVKEGSLLTLTDSLSCSLCAVSMAQSHGLIIVRNRPQRHFTLDSSDSVVCMVRPILPPSADILLLYIFYLWDPPLFFFPPSLVLSVCSCGISALCFLEITCASNTGWYCAVSFFFFFFFLLKGGCCSLSFYQFPF